MKRINAYLPILLMCLISIGAFSIPRWVSAQPLSVKGPPSGTCVTNCLRNYNKCLNNSAQSSSCYQQYMSCQQTCY